VNSKLLTNYFGENKPREDFGRRSLRGGLISIGARIANAFVQMATVVVLARLLSPEDYGLVSMVGAIIGVALVEELEKLAGSLGGTLEVPRLRWKYAWITPVFGLGLAKRAEFFLPRPKVNLLRFWDRAMYSMEGRQCDGPSDSRTTRVLALGYGAAAQFKGKKQ
jgi:hypothetical protein